MTIELFILALGIYAIFLTALLAKEWRDRK